MVLPISYLSLVFGELVPKSLALRYSEQIACFVARPIELLARVSAIFVKMLMASSNFVLRLFGGNNNESASFISVDEVKSLIREGTAKGIFNETERELIHSVFEFTDTPVKAVMKPRTEIHAIDAESSLAEVAKDFVDSGFSRIPVFEGNLDKIIGILYNKDVFKALQERSDFRIRDHLHQAFFVPSTLPISELLKQLQRRRLAMALVVNESARSKASLHWKIWSKRSSARFAMNTTVRNAAQWTTLPDGSMVYTGFGAPERSQS